MATDESSQNSITSEKDKDKAAQNGAATNGEHKTGDIEAEDEDYEIQEFDEPEEPVVVIEDDDDEVPPERETRADDNSAVKKEKTEEGDVEIKEVKVGSSRINDFAKVRKCSSLCVVYKHFVPKQLAV